ncbi:thaumatin-like protein [Moniliophthora roreri MCA 2997]|uniref:Thaumatin-like protein n=1 Tax=Moniliophthora roreri (strain MCA 2997) TaxID=1381753 RepID=V2XNJ0_MONRO|nr:thaumatin-like protein [Moniliophthora roreri MCA 2997]
MHFLTILVAAVASTATARTLTVRNNCAYTVWPAIFTDSSCGGTAPDQPTGWQADPNSSVTFDVDDWKCGRIWGRAGCDFGGVGSCLTGSCEGRLECTGSYEPPATVAEWTFSETGDFYDVSVVDGFNIPMAITNSQSCAEASCPVDLNQNCPVELQGAFNADGQVDGCNSDCLVDANPSDSASCCTGSHSQPANCPASGVPNYAYFKNNCPRAYAFVYDESSGSINTCAGKRPDYTLTFCP